MKAISKKQLDMYKRTLIRLSVDFSMETLQARRGYNDVFRVLKERKKKRQPRLLYLTKLSIIKEGEIDFPTQTKAQGVHYH